MEQTPPASPISVPLAIVLGLIASFVQSLGLTIQRKSHLQNQALPPLRQSTEWRRPLWLVGFAIFLCANVGGTVFQIGALPIVMLAPLGAVSLLYNALLARYLLNDFLSTYMITGTALIATGAVLIGYFGVVPSTAHDLDELLELYGRPTFVAFATIFAFLFIGVLAVSHLAEWQLHRRLTRSTSRPARTKSQRHPSRSRLRRRWSAPSLASVAEVSESSSGIATPVLAVADETARRSATFSNTGGVPSNGTVPSVDGSASFKPIPRGTPPRGYGSIPQAQQPPPKATARENGKKRSRRSSFEAQRLEASDGRLPLDAESVKKTKLMLSVAYGGASGTISGACLLLAKSGVELLMLSFSGHNQFVRWQSWMLIVVLLGAALMQLWYLNKALKLADPTLVCPLAFCFYNTSSIALGLVYFDQLGTLAWYDIVAVIVGISVLLAGVWIVSLHSNDGDAQGSDETVSLLSASNMSEASTTERTDQAEGLLFANAAGIAGPHLPVDAAPCSDTASDMSIDTQLSSSEAVNTHIASSSPTLSRTASSDSISSSSSTLPSKGSPVRKRRTSSTASRRRPTITLDFPINDSLFLPSPLSTPTTAGPGGSGDLEQGGPREGTAPHEDGLRLKLSALYNAIVEHGLSIGLSPSSPGFHLQPRSPSTFRLPTSESGPIHGSRRRPGRHPRRAMSEADAGLVPPRSAAAAAAAAMAAVREHEQEQEDGEDDAAASSGFVVEPDAGLLMRRLERLRKGGRRWLGGLLQRSERRTDGDGNGGSPHIEQEERGAAGGANVTGGGVGLGLESHSSDGERRPLLS